MYGMCGMDDSVNLCSGLVCFVLLCSDLFCWVVDIHIYVRMYTSMYVVHTYLL